VARVNVPETEIGPFRTLATLGSPATASHNAPAKWAELYKQTTFDVREREAFRHRMAHLVGCGFCAGLRSTSLMVDQHHEAVPDEFYEHIFDTAWEGYTTRERLIVEVIERFASDHEQLRDDDAFWAEMHANFTETEIVDLCYHMVGPQLGRVLMGKVLLGFSEFCEVQPAGAPARAADLV
jgi:alkylhydroperoxidase family enzyme